MKVLGKKNNTSDHPGRTDATQGWEAEGAPERNWLGAGEGGPETKL